MTLLEKFISKKLKAYKEPARMGTPKGEAVGFSRAKYHCSLLSLKKTKAIEIAADLKISHGLVRNWKTEQRFQETVQNHFEEFDREVVDLVEKSAPDFPEKAFADVAEWSAILRTIPAEKCLTPAIAIALHRLGEMAGMTDDAVVEKTGENWEPMAKRWPPERRLKIARAHVQGTKKILRKSVLTARDRHSLRVRLEIIEKLLG